MDEFDLPLLLWVPNPSLLYPKDGPPPRAPAVRYLASLFLPIGPVDVLPPKALVPWLMICLR